MDQGKNYAINPHMAIVDGKSTGLAGCSSRRACPIADKCLRADPMLREAFNFMGGDGTCRHSISYSRTGHGE